MKLVIKIKFDRSFVSKNWRRADLTANNRIRSSEFSPELEQWQKRACREDNVRRAQFVFYLHRGGPSCSPEKLCFRGFWAFLNGKLTTETKTQKWRGFKVKDREVYHGIGMISTGMPSGVSLGMMSMAKTKLRMAANTLLLAQPQLDRELTMYMALTAGNEFYWCKATLFWKTIFLFVSFLSQHLTLKIKSASSEQRENLICKLLMFIFLQSGNTYVACSIVMQPGTIHNPTIPISDDKIWESHRWTQSLCLPQHQSPSEHKHKKRRADIQNRVQKTCFHSPRRQSLLRQRELL